MKWGHLLWQIVSSWFSVNNSLSWVQLYKPLTIPRVNVVGGLAHAPEASGRVSEPAVNLSLPTFLSPLPMALLEMLPIIGLFHQPLTYLPASTPSNPTLCHIT